MTTESVNVRLPRFQKTVTINGKRYSAERILREVREQNNEEHFNTVAMPGYFRVYINGVLFLGCFRRFNGEYRPVCHPENADFFQIKSAITQGAKFVFLTAKGLEK